MANGDSNEFFISFQAEIFESHAHMVNNTFEGQDFVTYNVQKGDRS